MGTVVQGRKRKAAPQRGMGGLEQDPGPPPPLANIHASGSRGPVAQQNVHAAGVKAAPQCLLVQQDEVECNASDLEKRERNREGKKHKL